MTAPAALAKIRLCGDQTQKMRRKHGCAVGSQQGAASAAPPVRGAKITAATRPPDKFQTL
jgi:hypothetical protein